jgi:hypothetical protein
MYYGRGVCHKGVLPPARGVEKSLYTKAANITHERLLSESCKPSVLANVLSVCICSANSLTAYLLFSRLEDKT